jgi:hypothetical protein
VSVYCFHEITQNRQYTLGQINSVPNFAKPVFPCALHSFHNLVYPRCEIPRTGGIPEVSFQFARARTNCVTSNRLGWEHFKFLIHEVNCETTAFYYTRHTFITAESKRERNLRAGLFHAVERAAVELMVCDCGQIPDVIYKPATCRGGALALPAPSRMHTCGCVHHACSRVICISNMRLRTPPIMRHRFSCCSVAN